MDIIDPRTLFVSEVNTFCGRVCVIYLLRTSLSLNFAGDGLENIHYVGFKHIQ